MSSQLLLSGLEGGGPQPHSRPTGVLKRVNRRRLVIGRFDLRCAIESQADLERLAASIENDGLAHPPIVVPLGDGRYTPSFFAKEERYS